MKNAIFLFALCCFFSCAKKNDTKPVTDNTNNDTTTHIPGNPTPQDPNYIRTKITGKYTATVRDYHKEEKTGFYQFDTTIFYPNSTMDVIARSDSFVSIIIHKGSETVELYYKCEGPLLGVGMSYPYDTQYFTFNTATKTAVMDIRKKQHSYSSSQTIYDESGATWVKQE